MSFDARNIINLYRAGSLLTIAEELPKYKLDLVAVQDVRLEDGGIKPIGMWMG
jgi:hypothetical protein